MTTGIGSPHLASGLTRSRAVVAGATIAAVALVLAGRGHGHDERYTFHFVAVSATMLIAATGAIALTVAGTRLRDPRAIVVGMAFSVMATLLLLHGLGTPDLIVPDENESVLAFAGGATLPAGALILAFVNAEAVRGLRGSARLVTAQVVTLAAILAVGAAGLAFPSLLPTQPEARSAPAIVLLVGAAALFALLLVRVWRTFVLTRRRGDLWTVVGVAWLATALFASLLADPWTLPWWFGHGLETAGMLAIALPVAVDLRREHPSRALVGDLDAAQLVLAEEALLGAQVRSLMVRLAEKDASTEEHTRRVALQAVQLAERLGLGPDRLRTLAIGGLLHDIGKLQVPDEVLGKPARLTEEEFAVVRRHPGWGDELAAELGFGPAVRALIRSHHERLDGSGYPDALSGDELSLDVRILAACDVFDALVSARVYRTDAFTARDALALMRDEHGFDERCLAGLEAMVVSRSVS